MTLTAPHQSSSSTLNSFCLLIPICGNNASHQHPRLPFQYPPSTLRNTNSRIISSPGGSPRRKDSSSDEPGRLPNRSTNTFILHCSVPTRSNVYDSGICAYPYTLTWGTMNTMNTYRSCLRSSYTALADTRTIPSENLIRLSLSPSTESWI